MATIYRCDKCGTDYDKISHLHTIDVLDNGITDLIRHLCNKCNTEFMKLVGAFFMKKP